MSRTTIAELVRLGALVVGDGYRTKRSEHGRPGYRILRVADVGDGTFSFDGDDFVSAEFTRQIGNKLSQAGDVVLTTKGTVGRVGQIPKGAEQVVYSPQVCFFRVVDDNVLHPRYLQFWFRSADFKHQASDRANNTDMAAYINLADIRSLSFHLPTLDEQRAIAEVLGALDDKIAANARLVHTADQLAAALTREALTGEHSPLSDRADIIMGSSPPGSSYNETREGFVFYQGVRDFGVRRPSNRVWTTAPVRLAEAGDTLVSVRAPVGRTNLAAEETCIGRGLAAARSRDGRAMTLFHILRDAPEAWAPYESEGTVFGSINRRQLASLEVGVVSADRQAGLECQLVVLEGRIASALEESDRLAVTRDALLPGLMSGTIRVKDAERVVGEAV